MINLKELYGKRYKIVLDESWNAETPENRSLFRQRGEEPYYYELIGQNGHLYNHSETHLQIWINSRRIGMKIYHALLPGWSVHQNASDGFAFVLPNSDIDLALKWIRPRKRRHGPTDPTTLARLKELSKVHGFKKKGQNISTQ